MDNYKINKYEAEVKFNDARNQTQFDRYLRNHEVYQDHEPKTIAEFDTLEKAKSFLENQRVSAPYYECYHKIWLIEKYEIELYHYNEGGELEYTETEAVKENTTLPTVEEDEDEDE